MNAQPFLRLDEPAADIVIVGLGPGALGSLTLEAWQTLTGARAVLLRTRLHPCVEELSTHVELADCDDLYEAHADFDEVYDAVAGRVLAWGQEPGGCVYAVPGHPWVGEATTQRITERGRAAGLTVRIVDGVSFVEPLMAAMGLDPLNGAQVVDAMLLAREHHPRVDVGQTLVVGQLYARWLASDLKLTLMNAYPDEHPVTLVAAAGTDRQRLTGLPLYALDQHDDFDALTSLLVPPLRYGSFTDLQEIVAHLRSPAGCPWDQEQTLESLRQDLLGEAVEVLEAIDAEADGGDNSAHILEELGDLLLLPAMMTQIASEEGRFKMADVIQHIVEKLIRRHPHVFGDAAVSGVEEVFANWDAVKAQERAAKGHAPAHPLDGIPAHLPALEKARKLQAKAVKAGLLDRRALARSSPELVTALGPKPTAEGLGRLLWTLVALGQEHDLNAEDALRSYTVRLRRG